MLTHSLPAAERGAPLLRTIARELLASCVLRPIVGFAAPFWVNKGLLAALSAPRPARPAEPPRAPLPPTPPAAPARAAAPRAPPAPTYGSGDAETDEDDAAQSSEEEEAPDARRNASSGSLSELGEAAAGGAGGAGGPTRPLRAGLLSARVTGSSVLGDSSFSTHVAYLVTVRDGSGAEWVVQRRFSNFEALHRRVKALRARGRHKLPPKRILYHAPEGDFMDARKALLDAYLRDVLADARLAASPEVWDFLSAASRAYVPAPGAGGVLKSMSQGLAAGLTSASDAVSASVQTVAGSLDWRSRGAHAASAPAPAAAAAPPAAPASAPASPLKASAGASAGDAPPPPPPFEPPEPAGLLVPLLNLVDCVFRMREHGFVRRRMLTAALLAVELFVGGAVEEALGRALARVRSEATAVRLLSLVLGALWPDGRWFRVRMAEVARAEGRELPPPGTPPGFGGVPIGQEEAAREEAKQVWTLLARRCAESGTERLIGAEAQRRGTRELYGMLQSPLFVRHIGHSIVEAALAALYPEAEMLAVLHEVRLGDRLERHIRARRAVVLSQPQGAGGIAA